MSNNPPFPFQIIGFDLDGTLLDTSGDLAAACNHALGTIGRSPLPVRDIRLMIGGGAGMLLQRALEVTGGGDEALFKQLTPVMLDYYDAHISVHTHVFSGLIDALDGLAARGVRLAVVTNKLERYARKLIEEIGLAPHFACVLGGDTLGSGKAKPAPDLIYEMIAQCGGLNTGERAAFVGDTQFDISAARNAGIPSVAVSFGFIRDAAEIAGADAIIDHYDELIGTLARL